MNQTTDRPTYIPDAALTCLSDRPLALLAELSRRGYSRIPAVQPTEYARMRCGDSTAVIIDARAVDVDTSCIRVVVVEPRESGAA